MSDSVELVLQVFGGPGRGMSVPLVPGKILEFGRADSASVCIAQDSQLSRRHFSIVAEEGGTLELRDVGSANGTLVNGRRVTVTSLRVGDRIDAGESTFVLRGVSKSHADDLNAASRSPSASSRVSPVSSSDDVLGVEERPALQIQNATPFPVMTIVGEDAAGQPRLTVVLKATFTLEPDGVPKPASSQLPIRRSDEHYEGKPLGSVRFEADTAPFKPCADVVLVGSAYAPKGQPVRALGVRLRVGSREWTIAVFGDREWRMSLGGLPSPMMTDPKPFTRMELTYERAFGGIDAVSSMYWPYNLVGTGFIGRLSHDSVHERRLPNLEDPSNYIRRWNTRHKPMGFGFFGRGWLPRLKYAGTYDDQYRKAGSTRLPSDFSDRLFNAAHPDLQIEGYLAGDEPVELVNLSPRGALSFHLPGLRPSVMVRRSVPGERRSGQAGEMRLAAKLDTLCLVPDDQLFYLVFRAVCPLGRGRALDIEELLVRL